MGTRLALGAAALVLVLSAIAAVAWWVVLWRQAPLPDGRVWIILGAIAVVQLVAWVVVVLLLVRARRQSSLPLALTAMVLGSGSLASHLVNGFTPVIGAAIGLAVLMSGVLAAGSARRPERTT